MAILLGISLLATYRDMETICFLTSCKAQLKLLQTLWEKLRDVPGFLELPQCIQRHLKTRPGIATFLLSTVDEMQGGTDDLTILSMVRSLPRGFILARGAASMWAPREVGRALSA